MLLVFVSLLLLNLAAAPAQGQPPPSTPVPNPQPTATPPPDEGDDSGDIINQIFQVVFQDKTLAEALLEVLTSAAEDEAEQLAAETAEWTLILGDVLQAPSEGYYEAIAMSSLYTAAALAPALFLLRLALYHWHRLFGADDSALQVLGDWITGGALAVAAGPFLDLLVSLGWWMAGAALGETSQLALAFVQATSVFDVLNGIGQVSLFSPILYLGASIGGVLAMVGMLFAFGVAQAVMYVLAVLAPPVAVATVIPHMRWLRSLWLKAVVILALLPLVAGGIFKASVSLGLIFSGGGILSLLIRLLWLWGAVGFLFALVGILGRVTLSASVDALKQAAGVAKAIVSTAALALTVGASVASSSAASAGGGTGAAGATGGGNSSGGGGTGGRGAASSATVSSNESGDESDPAAYDEAMLHHYFQAQALTHQAGTWGALGLRAPAQYAQNQAHEHELAARQLALQQRLARYQRDELPEQPEESGGSRDLLGLGFSPSVNRALLSGYSGSPQAFQRHFEQLSPRIEEMGLDPKIVAQTFPRETGQMVRAYQDDPQGLEVTPSPLLEAARRGKATNLQNIFASRPSTQIPNSNQTTKTTEYHADSH
ncbi:MAG: hypothetical protein Fur0022_02440 [Anaerolineales bacterium]